MLLLWSPAGYSQDSGKASVGAAEQAKDLIVYESVKVTARKREENPKDVPVSVDVVTEERLNDRRLLALPDIVRDSPGVNIGDNGDRRSSVLSIRGLGPLSGVANNFDDTSMLTFIDGVPQSIFAADSQLLDVEQVEILKGPQTTIFGRNTLGGAINITPQRPTFGRSLSLLTEGGSDGQRRFELKTGGTVVPHKLAGRIAARYSGIDGFLPNLYGSKLGGEEAFSGRGAVLWALSARTGLELSASGERLRTRPYYFSLREDPRYPLAAVTESSLHRGSWANALKLNHSAGRAQLTGIAAFSSTDLQLDTDDTDSLLWSALTGAPKATFETPNDYSRWQERETKWYGEFRAAVNPESRRSWLAGLSLYRDRFLLDYNNSHIFAPTQNGFRRNRYTVGGLGLFADATLPVTKKLSFSVGGRFSREAKGFEEQYRTNGFPGNVPFFRNQQELDFNFWTGRAALVYDISQTVAVFASAARGFKTGGFPRFSFDAYQGLASLPYRSASSRSYEGGLKLRDLTHKIRLSLAYFRNDVEDEQLFALDFQNFVFRVYNGDIRTSGFEADTGIRLGRSLDFTAALAYLTGRGSNFDPVLRAQGIIDGNRPTQMPRYSVASAITHRARLASSWLRSPELVTVMSYNYVGPRFGDINNLVVLEPVHVGKIRLALHYPRWELYAYVNNVADLQYTTQAINYGPGVQTAMPARGRVAGAGLNLRLF
ncbi:MAG TPA: TonB-dependent receptor [Bryobacteraceae bacterium]|nr:TonB-dependent receptor [Bryobacteraceae bacterium]